MRKILILIRIRFFNFVRVRIQFLICNRIRFFLGPDPVVVFFVDPYETFHFYSGQDPAVWFNSYGNRIMVIFFVQGTPLTRLCITTYTVGPKCRRPAGIEQCYPAVSVCFVFIFLCIRVTKTCHIHLSLWLCCGSESGSVSFFACDIQIRLY